MRTGRQWQTRAGLLAIFAMGLLTAAHAQDTPKDMSPGWVVILTADRKGPQGEHYQSVQRDAIRLYKMAVTEWGVAPDHIVLLAEGDLIETFRTQGILCPPYNGGQVAFFAKCLRWKDGKSPTLKSLLTAAQTAALPEMQENIASFQNLVAGQGDQFVPVRLRPSRGNFRLVREVMNQVVKPDQFLAVLLSTTAGETIAPIVPKTLGKDEVAASEGLEPKDFDGSASKAKYRILLMDSGATGYRSPLNVGPDDASYINEVREQWIQSAENNAVFISATDGTQFTWHKPEQTGSAFVQGICDQFRDKTALELALKSTFEAVRDRYRCNLVALRRALLRQNTSSSEIRTPEVACVLSRDAIAKQKAGTVLCARPGDNQKVKLIRPEDVRAEAVAWQGEKQVCLFIKNYQIAQIFGDSTGRSAEKRGAIIAQRLKNLLDPKWKLTGLDLLEIRAKWDEQAREWVVKLPGKVKDKKGHLLTADKRMTRLVNKTTPEELATSIAVNLRTYLDNSAAQMMADNERTEQELLWEGINAVNAGNYKQAETQFQKATERAPEYMEAYLWLLDVQKRQKAAPRFAETLATLTDMKAAGAVLTAEQTARLVKLTK